MMTQIFCWAELTALMCASFVVSISTFRQAPQKYLYSLVFTAVMLHVSVAVRPSSGKNTFNIKEESAKAEVSPSALPSFTLNVFSSDDGRTATVLWHFLLLHECVFV
jgi:hypothetical protein